MSSGNECATPDFLEPPEEGDQISSRKLVLAVKQVLEPIKLSNAGISLATRKIVQNQAR